MKIAKLEPSKHRQGRWLVWLEDGSLLRVGENEVLAFDLYAGRDLTDGEAEELTRSAQRGRRKQRAMELAAARPVSRSQVERKLEQWGADEAEQAAVCDRMEELKMLDDGAYAAQVVRHYAAKGFGPKKIRDELYRRGVPRDYWDEALAALDDQADCVDRLVERRLRGLEPTRENLKKASDYLARRGFSWEDISAALERYEEEL